MQVKVDASALRRTRWHDYAVRFLFGGLITAVTGIIAIKLGPAIGGLFLAFPAIFPASATLIEKNEIKKKHKAGLHGSDRGRKAASVDAAGSAIGSLGLIAFGLLVWKLLPHFSPWPVLLISTFAWLLVSITAWKIRKRM